MKHNHLLHFATIAALAIGGATLPAACCLLAVRQQQLNHAFKPRLI